MGDPPIRYCHELKPDQDRGFKDGHEPSSREHPKCRVGNSARQPWPRQEGREKQRLTGQWRDLSERFHLFINQAGTHIELLFAFVEGQFFGSSKDDPSDKKRLLTRAFRMGGDVDESNASRDVYLLYAHHPSGPTAGKQLGCGRLRHSKGAKRIKLELDLKGLDGNAAVLEKLERIKYSTADRIGTAPNLFENLLQKSVPEAVRTMLWFPLTPTQVQALPTFLLTEVNIVLNPSNFKIDPEGTRFRYTELVERYFEIQTDEDRTLQHTRWLTNIASALDSLVKKARTKALNTPAYNGGVDGHQEHHWKLATLQGLASRTLMLDPGFPRTLLTLTQAIIDGSIDATLTNFEKLLGLTKKTDHEYHAEIELFDLGGAKDDAEKVGKSLGKFGKFSKKVLNKVARKIKRRLPFGTLAGTLVVRKEDHGPFEAKYLVAFAGLKISASGGSSTALVKSSGVATNVFGQAWRPENIPGTAFWSDTGVAGYAGGGGSGVGMTFLYCMGGGASAPKNPLNFNFSGLSQIVAPGAGGGVTGMACFGTISPIEIRGGDVVIDLSGDDEPFEYQVPSTALHFPINGAGLTGDGIELVEIFAACELAALSQPGVRLEVHGYADQPDKELSNLILSRNRAITVYNFLKNILGDDLRTGELGEVPEESVERRNAEELAAKEREQKGKDSTMKYIIADPSNRTGGIVIHAHGEVGKSSGYDSEARRVEVHVDGIASLSLRRRKDK